MDVMTANSKSVADFYRDEIGIAEDVLHVIPNGVAELPAAEPGGLHRELGVLDDYRLIGFAGRLAPQKNLRDLIWAFHLLKQSVTGPVGLVFIGDGPERDRLAQFAVDLGRRDSVFFMGHRNDATCLIQELAVFCLPSAFEGMSNSLMEAMACGLPCVVSDIASNQELIQHEQNGLVFPVGNTTRLAKILLQCLNDQQCRRQLGQAAKETISQDYNVTSLVRRHQDLYQRLLEDLPRGSASHTEDR